MAAADRAGRRRGDLALVVAAIGVLALGTGWALAAPGLVYGWRQSMLSDLGARTCLEAAGRWICSPRHAAFDAAQLIAGSVLLGAAVVTGRARRPWSAAARAAAGVGLVLLGAFPSDVAHTVHMVGAATALPVAAAFLLAAAIRRGDPPLRGAPAAVALALTAVHLVPGTTLRGVAELVSVVGLCLAFLLDATRLHPGDRCAVRPRDW